MAKKLPTEEAIMVVIKEWDRLSPNELSKKTGHSIWSIRSWAKNLRQNGVSLVDRRKFKKKIVWSKFKKNG